MTPNSEFTKSAPPVRWGILGTARIAEKLAPAIRLTPTATLLAIASRDPQRGRDFAAQHEIPVVCTSYEELLARPDIDAVYIPLPPSLHADWTIRALQAGKHVLCEKPLAVHPADAARMAEVSRATNRLLVDGVMWRHHPRAAAMSAFLERGDLGPLRRVTSAFTFPADKFPADDLRFRRELGGGALLDLGWYCVGAILWATRRMPTRVFGAAKYVNDVDRQFAAMLWFDDDLQASFDCGFETTTRKWLEIAGTRASLVCDDFTRPWQQEKPRFWVHDQQGKVAEHLSSPDIQEHCLVAEFCRRVQQGDVGTDGADEAVRVQQICAALERSAREGRPLVFEP